MLASRLLARRPRGDPLRPRRDGGRPATGPRPTPRCAACSSHADVEVRRRALAILNEAGDRSIVPQVEALLRDPHLEVRTEALLYLSRHADVDPLARLRDLGDYPDFSVRAAVVAVLARLGDDRLEAARPLFESMVAEPGEAGRRTRLEAARLAERQPLPFEDALVRLVADEDDEVARTAIRAAARHGAAPFADALVARLGEPPLAEEAADALVAAGRRGARFRLAGPRRPADRPPPRGAPFPAVLERIGTDEAALVLDRPPPRRRRRPCACASSSRSSASGTSGPRWRSTPGALEAALGAEVLGHYRSYQILGPVDAREPGERDRSAWASAPRCRRSWSGSSDCSTSCTTAGTSARPGWRCVGERLHPRPGARPPRQRAAARDEGAPRAARGPRGDGGAAGPPRPPARRRPGRDARAGGRGARRDGRSVAALVRGLRDRRPWACVSLGRTSRRGSDDPDPLLRETVRQARERLAQRP